MNLTLEQFGIDRLNSEQRLQLIQLIYDSLPEDAPIVAPAWHIEELERRIAAAEADPASEEPWEVVRARLTRKP